MRTLSPYLRVNPARRRRPKAIEPKHNGDLAWLLFEDQAPRIGAGLRHCEIKIGRVWVRIWGVHGGFHRFTKKEWGEIARGSARRAGIHTPDILTDATAIP